MNRKNLTLEEENHLLHQILHRAPIFLGTVGPDHRMQYYNFSEVDGVRIDVDDVIGKHVKDLHWWSHLPEISDTVVKCVDTALAGETVEVELPNRHADGKNSVSRIHFRPLKDTDGTIRSVLCTGLDITAEVAERNYQTMLLREVNHRVKNSLQLVSSILNLEANAAGSNDAKDGFLRAASRVVAVSRVHDLIYRIDSFETIPFKPYLEDLCAELESSIDNSRQKLRILRESHEASFKSNHAISIALIVNELVTNSLKYAFVDRDEGVINVSLAEEGDNYVLSVADDGQGKVAEVQSTGLGGRMIEVLARQIGATIVECESTIGHRVEIKFPKPEL